MSDLIDVLKAKRLMYVIDERRKFEDEEKELKAYFKLRLEGSTMVFGSVSVTPTDKARSYLDTKAVKEYLGQEVYRGFEKITTWTEISVQEVAQIIIHNKALEGAFAPKRVSDKK